MFELLKDNLKRLRKQQNKTQKQVAEFLGITREAYTQYENGSRRPDYETINSLADFFEVTVDSLLGRSEKKSEEQKEIVLSEKELKAIKKKAEGFKDSMIASIGIAFDGEVEDEETLEKVLIALEEGMILAKKEAKRKFTPNKFKKNKE